MALEIAAAVRRVPTAAIRHLERGSAGDIEETVKPGDPRLARAAFEVIGNRETAIEGAAGRAAALGYHVVVRPEPTHGEARTAGPAFMSGAMADVVRPLCVLAAGETTVRVTGPGRGGRNQEFVLAALPLVETLSPCAVLASYGTDGRDGPTDAAGALADSTSTQRARRAGLDRDAALGNNDAYPFFAALGDLILSGRTGSNVGDLQVLLVA
jgi:hydroxypyruvate reductase